MGFRWFNWIGFLMLTLVIFLNEFVYLQVWEEFSFGVVAFMLVYMMVALTLSVWGGSQRQEA